MTDWTPSEDAQKRIFEERIAPVVFPHEPADGAPTLLVLDGQVGANGPAAASHLARDYPDGIAIVSNDGLIPFHPHYVELGRSRSPEAFGLLTEPTAGWVSRSLRYARTTRRSLLLEGTFQNPGTVVAATELFAQNGFATRVAVIASPRAESLLAAASGYLLDVRAGRAGRFTDAEGHDAGFDATRTLTGSLEREASVDRLTVVGRHGAVLFDGERTDASAFAGATAALIRGQSVQMTGAQGMRWLSELRAATDFALAAGRVEGRVAELLIELHEVALDEVLPRMPLPTDSQARPAAEASLVRQVAELRRSAPVQRPRVDVPAPAISPSGPDRGISR